MNEFTIRVTESNGVVGIALSAPKESKPLAHLVSKALNALLPMVVTRAVDMLNNKECACPDCEARRAAEGTETPATDRTIH